MVLYVIKIYSHKHKTPALELLWFRVGVCCFNSFLCYLKVAFLLPLSMDHTGPEINTEE